MAKKSQLPKYTHHKPTGQAFARVDGKMVYLGKYNSPESHERYATEISDWQARRWNPPSELRVRQLSVL